MFRQKVSRTSVFDWSRVYLLAKNDVIIAQHLLQIGMLSLTSQMQKVNQLTYGYILHYVTFGACV